MLTDLEKTIERLRAEVKLLKKQQQDETQRSALVDELTDRLGDAVAERNRLLAEAQASGRSTDIMKYHKQKTLVAALEKQVGEQFALQPDRRELEKNLQDAIANRDNAKEATHLSTAPTLWMEYV